MNNIQKAFKTKSKLRGMADGGQVDPRILGSGMAQRAGSLLQGRHAQLDAAIDAASGASPPRPAPTPVTAAPAKKPEEKSALRSFFGLADGGQVFKNTVGGVPTYTDARAATAGATAHTPGSGGGTFSVIGMEPAQRQQMADAAAQRQAAANAPTTLGGRLDAALGKLNSPAASAGAPSSTPTLGSELDAAIGRTQGVTSAQTPATGAPANATSGFTPQERQTFNSMSQAAAADAAQMRDIGLRAGEAAAAAARPASPLQSSSFDEPSFELEFADGGKVKGKGGPTDDKVGPVMLSDGEYVLPADTVEIVGRDKLDALRLATHDFVDDSNKPKVSSLRKMVNGGPVYADPEDVANRRLLSGGLGQPPQTAAGSSGGGGRGIVPHQLTATGSPGGGGRGLVPNRPPSTAMVPYEPPVTKLSPTETPRPQAGATSKFGNALRTGGALLATGLEAKNVYDAYQSGGVDAAVPEAAMGATRLASAKLGASAGAALPLPGWGKSVAAGVLGAAGYMAPNAVANSEFAKEKGRESALRGAFSSRLDSGFAPTFDPRANTITTSDGRVFGSGRPESNPHLQYQGYLDAKAGQAVDSKEPLMNPTVAELDAIGALRPRNSNPSTDVVFNPTVADLERAGALRPAVSMDAAMGNLRAGNAPGGGFRASDYPDIYVRDNPNAGNPGESARQYIGVGTPAPQEDPIMGEIRSALRGLTDGAGNRGGGGGSTASARKAMADINKRYDDMLRNGAGRNRVRGLDWSQRHGLDVERARAGELGEFARNQSALRGQDMQASTAANNANMQARMQALQTLGTMANQRSTQSAQAQAAADKDRAAAARAQIDAAKAQAEAEAAERSASEAGVKDLSDYIETAFPDDPEGAARYRTFVQSAGPDQVGELTTLHGGDRRRAFEDMRQRMLIQDRGGGGNIFTGKRSSGYDPVADVNLDPGWRDILSAWWDGGMGARDTGLSMLKEFSVGDNSLVTHDSGQVRPASKLRGGDMRSTKTIEDMVADRPRREARRRAATDN